ncbi:hypothetical protein EST38_g1549 [Candolleomyces aberdarensis]|uniref:Transposase family Tnp2 protein n=1 Tax=Candolleomyces aberdarensis TaxID=2316362 RepID=A0A4Q2DX64_9AGAR|nr:hypothetical protein EST38_g1549 [Candolleomyces aberdarensis]
MEAPGARYRVNSTGSSAAGEVGSPSGSKRTLDLEPDVGGIENDNHEDDEGMDRTKRLRQDSPQWGEFNDAPPDRSMIQGDGTGSDSMDAEQHGHELRSNNHFPSDDFRDGSNERNWPGGDENGGGGEPVWDGPEDGGPLGEDGNKEGGRLGSGDEGEKGGGMSEDEVEEEGRHEGDKSAEGEQGPCDSGESSKSSDEEAPEDARHDLEAEAARLLERQRQDAADQQQCLFERQRQDAIDQQQRTAALAGTQPAANSAPPEPEPELLADQPSSQIRHLHQTQEFIRAIQSATLFNGKLDPRVVEQLMSTPNGELEEDEDGNVPVYEDIFSGSELRELAREHQLSEDDITIGFSFDGAQLYRNKQSDTWIAIWIVFDYDPVLRYKRKHILPALIVPGPNKPKNIDSFLFRSFHHLSALQRMKDSDGIEGLPAWDWMKQAVIHSRIFFILGMADALCLRDLDGRVGHHGAHGCRLGCPFKGRHKANQGHYYSAHLAPTTASPGCNHEDYDFAAEHTASEEEYWDQLRTVLQSETKTEYEQNRLDTGASKPSIVCGLHPSRMLKPPKCFSVDLMHLFYLNLPDLLIPLFRGEMECEATDNKCNWDWMVLFGDIWNPQLKISSGYKATEYWKLLIDLMPAHLIGLLPDLYWKNLCRIVHAVRIITRRSVTLAQVKEAHEDLVNAILEFEYIYYQRRLDRMHFCRPCLHTLLHTAPEILRVGPGAYSNQFPLKRIIGQFGRELRQPGSPFANLMEIAVHRSQTNIIKILYPHLDHDPKFILPKYAEDLGNGFVFLRPRQSTRRDWLATNEAVRETISIEVNMNRVAKWGRLRLPNGQICRSFFSESNQHRAKRRISRNVKINCRGQIEYGEVQFFFYTQDMFPKAVVSLYGPPDMDLYESSFKTHPYQHQSTMSELSEPLEQGDITLVDNLWDQLSKNDEILRPQYTECYGYRRRLLATKRSNVAGIHMDSGSDSSEGSEVSDSVWPGLNISKEDYLLNAFDIMPLPCPFGDCSCAECRALAQQQAEARFQFNSKRMEPGSALNELEMDELNRIIGSFPMLDHSGESEYKHFMCKLYGTREIMQTQCNVVEEARIKARQALEEAEATVALARRRYKDASAYADLISLHEHRVNMHMGRALRGIL